MDSRASIVAECGSDKSSRDWSGLASAELSSPATPSPHDTAFSVNSDSQEEEGRDEGIVLNEEYPEDAKPPRRPQRDVRRAEERLDDLVNRHEGMMRLLERLRQVEANHRALRAAIEAAASEVSLRVELHRHVLTGWTSTPLRNPRAGPFRRSTNVTLSSSSSSDDDEKDGAA